MQKEVAPTNKILLVKEKQVNNDDKNKEKKVVEREVTLTPKILSQPGSTKKKINPKLAV